MPPREGRDARHQRRTPHLSPRARTPEPGAAGLEVLLVHPGGPYFAKKDAGAWSIPKGLAEPDELGPEPATATAAKARNRAAGRICWAWP